jgi:hypothetical protein
MKINAILLISTIAICCLLFTGCTDSNNREDNKLKNNPALDTVDIKQDTTNNFPLPLPDSTINSTDSIAKL